MVRHQSGAAPCFAHGIAVMQAGLESYRSLPQAFFDQAARDPRRRIYSQVQPAPGTDSSRRPRRWRECTAEDLARRVSALAGYLRSIGVGSGSKAAIISYTRPEWLEADLAILSLGAVVVSIYPNLPAEMTGYILYDSGADVVFVENRDQALKILELTAAPCQIPATEDRAAAVVRLALRKIICFEEAFDHPMVASLAEAAAGEGETLPREIEKIKPDDLACLVYTSGTTGPPKGVMQTHGNHLANLRQVARAGLHRAGDRVMLFLPLAHSFAKLMQYAACTAPVELLFPAPSAIGSGRPDPASVLRDLREGGATIVPLVPRVLEKMQAGIEAQARRKSPGGLILSVALVSAQHIFAARRNGGAARPAAQIAFLATAWVRRAVRRRLFGPCFRYAICGGAKLNMETAAFFAALGIEVLEGYGLTETCVATNVNLPGRNRIGTVGPVIDKEIELRLADDGEILYRGPNVTPGYYRRATATRAAWDRDGWFHTGDLGALDGEGNLSIIGRKKGFLLTSYGKHVCAERIEHDLTSSLFISQAVLVGEGRPYCAALLTLDKQAVKAWARRRSLRIEGRMYDHPVIRELIAQEVDRVNRGLPAYETIKRFQILPLDFTVENGLLTPTLKAKKEEVMARFAAEIERLYQNGRSA